MMWGLSYRSASAGEECLQLQNFVDKIASHCLDSLMVHGWRDVGRASAPHSPLPAHGRAVDPAGCRRITERGGAMTRRRTRGRFEALLRNPETISACIRLKKLPANSSQWSLRTPLPARTSAKHALSSYKRERGRLDEQLRSR